MPKRIPRKVVHEINRFITWVDEKGRWIYLILILCSILALVILGWRVGTLGSENQQRISDIEDSRYALVYTGCVDQNKRNDNTIKQLNKIYAEIKPPQERANAEPSRKLTILLINALAPHRKSCAAYAQRRVRQADTDNRNRNS